MKQDNNQFIMLAARISRRTVSPCMRSVAVSSTCHRVDPCVWMNERQLDYLDAITNYLSNCHVHYNWDMLDLEIRREFRVVFRWDSFHFICCWTSNDVCALLFLFVSLLLNTAVLIP